MFFNLDNITLRIDRIWKLQQENVSLHSRLQENAVSYRFVSDAVLIGENNQVFQMCDHMVSFVPVNYGYTRTAGKDELIVIHFQTDDYDGQEIESFVPAEPERFAVLFRKILECWEAKKLGYRHDCTALFYNIMAECQRQVQPQYSANSRIERSVEYLHTHYRNSDLTIEEIAAQSFISEVQFRKLFKEEFGMSPHKYIVQLRMMYATDMMSSGLFSLNEIAFMSGYTDYKYFSTSFRRYKGVSPSEYSKTLSKNTSADTEGCK